MVVFFIRSRLPHRAWNADSVVRRLEVEQSVRLTLVMFLTRSMDGKQPLADAAATTIFYTALQQPHDGRFGRIGVVEASSLAQ